MLDRPLSNIPVAALYDGQQFLIETYSVSSSPGLQFLGPKPLDRRSLTALVAGSTASFSEFGLPRVPQVQMEVDKIASTGKWTDVVLVKKIFPPQPLGEESSIVLLALSILRLIDSYHRRVYMKRANPQQHSAKNAKARLAEKRRAEWD